MMFPLFYVDLPFFPHHRTQMVVIGDWQDSSCCFFSELFLFWFGLGLGLEAKCVCGWLAAMPAIQMAGRQQHVMAEENC